MNTLFICIVALLIILAVFDLVVGVSNDAVNFLNSAVGAKVARYRTIATVAAIGVFLGAAISNGMMDVARHGIMTPMYYSFYDVICIFLAVMVTDVVLLDVFNTLGMPTSTTVSMVFELLGGAFAIALIGIVHGRCGADGTPLTLGDLLNTEKAISVILGIFLSVAIAFALGTIVQWIARLVFTFNNRRQSIYKTGILSGIAITGIVWFLLINGLKGSSFMTPEMKSSINAHAWEIIAIGIVAFSAIMTLLCYLRVRVLQVVVLLGTMALAMAFASNDLVNFIGVPLTGLEAYLDYNAAGDGDATGFMMTSLMADAHTSWPFLATAGAIMVLSLAFSKKAKSVVQTSVGLSRQDEGDEMFGSSAVARAITRNARSMATVISNYTPRALSRWINARFDSRAAELPDGAAFDEVRAVVNLVVASVLVALGTSMKLPLSTTYVTFMVAMGSSLADRAWGRESAVYRITGVLSVIGGWFITAGAAFIIAYLLTNILHFGSFIAMILAVALAVTILIRSNFIVKRHTAQSDDTFQTIMRSHDEKQSWQLVCQMVRTMCDEQLAFVAKEYGTITSAFFAEEYRKLKHVKNSLEDYRKDFKRVRRRGILALRRINPRLAVERNTWFFLITNALSQTIHSLERIAEPCQEHVGNNFRPVPETFAKQFQPFAQSTLTLVNRGREMIARGNTDEMSALRADADKLRKDLAAFRKTVIDYLQTTDDNLEAMSVLLNIVQETQEIISALRHAARGANNFLATT